MALPLSRDCRPCAIRSAHQPDLRPRFNLATWGAADHVGVIGTHAVDWPDQALAVDTRIAKHVACNTRSTPPDW
jgi:hypothetical protein